MPRFARDGRIAVTASRPENAIDFGCLQCQARLWAGPSEAGQRLRCPFCQFVQPVPTAKEAAARAAKSGPESEYGLHEGSEPQGPEQEYITLTCPVCATRLVAAPDQVGQTLKCPDCDTVVEVRVPVAPAIQRRPIRPATPGDEYPLWGVGQPPPDVKAVYQTYIPVVCPVCRTRMLGTEAEVGQKLTCPDCGTATVVPPPAPKPARRSVPAPAAADDADYALREDAGRPGRDSAGYEALFPVVCPLCQTRLHAAPEQVGQELICPDCQTPILVRAPAAAPPKIDPMAGAEAGYSIVPTAEMPAWQPVFTSVWAEDEADAQGGQNEGGPPPQRVSPRGTIRPPEAVQGSLWRGIAGFLLMPTIWPRWLLFSAGMLGVLILAWIAVFFSMIPQIPAWIFGLGFSGLAGMFAILWLVVFSATAVVIVVETASGADSIENWPEGPYQDWMPDAFYVVNSWRSARYPEWP